MCVFRALGILGPLSRPAPPADKKLPWKTHFFNGHLIEILLKKDLATLFYISLRVHVLF